MSAQKFEEVFRSNYRLLFSLGYQLSGNRALTKDVIQAFFLELWEKQVLQKNIDNTTAYLRKSFYRKMMAELKAKRVVSLSVDIESKLLSTPSYEELLINSSRTRPKGQASKKPWRSYHHNKRK